MSHANQHQGQPDAAAGSNVRVSARGGGMIAMPVNQQQAPGVNQQGVQQAAPQVVPIQNAQQGVPNQDHQRVVQQQMSQQQQAQALVHAQQQQLALQQMQQMPMNQLGNYGLLGMQGNNRQNPNAQMVAQLNYGCLKILQEKEFADKFCRSVKNGQIQSHSAQSMAQSIQNQTDKNMFDQRLYQQLILDETLKQSVANKKVETKTFGNPQKPEQQVKIKMSKEQHKMLEHWKAFLDDASPDEKLKILKHIAVFKPKKRVVKFKEKLEAAKAMKIKQAEKQQAQDQATFSGRNAAQNQHKVLNDPLKCPVAKCTFQAEANRSLENKLAQTTEQEEQLKKHYSEDPPTGHSDLEKLGLGLTLDPVTGRLACKLNDTMLIQLCAFSLANKQQVQKFQIDEEEREVKDLKKQIKQQLSRKRERPEPQRQTEQVEHQQQFISNNGIANHQPIRRQGTNLNQYNDNMYLGNNQYNQNGF